MIFKRYGTSYQSVDPNFDSRALNEIGFRLDRERAVPVEEFETRFEHVSTHELSSEAEGPVQDHTEQLMIDRLAPRVEDGLSDGKKLISGKTLPAVRKQTLRRN